MSDEILKAYAGAVKKQYPALSVEAVICFALVAGADDPLSISEIAQKAKVTEPVAYKELASLTLGAGAGLVTFVNMGSGMNKVQLTPLGAQFRNQLGEMLGL